ncbi:MAG: hypothetical protein ACRD3Q_10450, partial [Terriglobales bacterium]
MINWQRLVPFVVAVSISVSCAGQTAPVPNQAGEIEQLRSSLTATRSELDGCRQEIEELRAQIRDIQKSLASGTPLAAARQSTAATQFPALGDLEKNQPATQSQAPADEQMLAAKVTEFEQTKVETISKYKLRVSGLVLMNAYSNSGNVDVTDLPNRAFRQTAGGTGGDIGATVRQTTLGLEVTGPTVAGASTSGSVSMDFYGGFPSAHYGITMGIARIRTAVARMDWSKWSVVAGQDEPFFSPLSPTSYASRAEPAFSWSGNLWVWTPQVRIERRLTISERSKFVWTLGVLDPLSEEAPDSTFSRQVDPGEATRMPGFGTHFSWNGEVAGNHATIGLGGYFGRQNWGFDKRINSWLLSTDFEAPIGRYFEISGEIYRGQAIGGLGGGIWASALFDGNPDIAGTHILPLNDIGGWT